MKTFARYVVWMALGVAVASCATVPSEKTPSSPPVSVEDLRRWVAGWAPEGYRLYDEAVQQFTPDNLYEQIDGRAEFFLAYNVAGMTFANFEDAADPRRSIDVSIYDMGAPTNAFGVFSAERSGGETPVSLGRAAYRSGSNVYVWKGAYYVQVIALSAEKELEGPAMALARKAADALPDSGEAVWGVAALPEQDRVADSIRYFQVDALGLDFLRNTYTAQYRKGDVLIDVFLSRQDSVALAQATLARYAEYATQYGRGTSRHTVAGHEFLVCEMGNAFDVVFQKGRLVGGITAASDRGKAVDAAIDFRRQLREE